MPRNVDEFVSEFSILKGSDLPKNATQVTITVSEVRDSPSDWKSPLIFMLRDITYDRNCWTPNMGSLQSIGRIYRDLDDVAGKTMVLTKHQVTNPQTRKDQWGLKFERFLTDGEAAAPAAAPAAESRRRRR